LTIFRTKGYDNSPYMEWRLAWWDSAECAKTDRDVQDCFFPDPEEDSKEVVKRKELIAQMICASCVVQDQCLLFALDTNERYGVWGMHTQADRRELKRWMTRHPDRASYHWDRSFAKIRQRIESALNTEATQGIAVAAIQFRDGFVEDETLVVGRP